MEIVFVGFLEIVFVGFLEMLFGDPKTLCQFFKNC